MTDAPALQPVPEQAAYGGGLLPSALLPPVVHEASAALLVVDLTRREITYANDLAHAMAPDVVLPVGVDEWSEAAGLEDVGGVGLPSEADEDDPRIDTRGRSESLVRVAQGEPVLGEAVTARRPTEVAESREPLWVIGLPMTEAPEPVSHLALVAFMPLRNAQLVAGAQESATMLRDRAVLATKVSFTISDPSRPDNPLVWVNPAFTATTGYTLDDVVERNCRFLQGPHTDRAVVREIRGALQQQRAITTTLLNYRKDGSAFWNELSISPVLDSDGAVTHFVGVQADVTARVEAQQARDAALQQAELAAGRLGLLADFAKRLSGSLERDDILELVTEVLVPTLGTWCVVTVVDDDGRLLTHLRHERGDRPEVAQRLESLREHLGDASPSSVPLWRVLSGEARYLLLPDLSTPEAREQAGLYDDERSRLADELGTEGLLMVPLRARDRVLGSVTVAVDSRRRSFTADDVALVSELAARAALMLENSLLYARQLSASVTLQHSLLPQLPSVSGLSIDAAYVTASDQAAVGGDWYDVFALKTGPAGSVGIAVGDAMGHNFDSAAAMGKLATMLRSYAWPGAEPAAVLDAVEDLLDGTGQNYLATCVYGALRPVEGGAEFAWSSAGHPPPILRLPDGSAAPLEGGHGPMIGITSLVGSVTARAQQTRTLERGSTLVFFTDGLTDSMGDELDINAAVAELACIVTALPADASPSDVVAALVDRTSGGRKDDVAIVAVRID